MRVIITLTDKGGIMKKLVREEIIKLEDSLWDNINDDNKFYFEFERKGYSQEGYLLNGYYLNLNEFKGLWWLGLIKLSEGSLKGLLGAFKKLLEAKERIAIYRNKDNLQMKGLHDRALKFFGGKQLIIDNYVVTIIENKNYKK